jgi:hypothetical protein
MQLPPPRSQLADCIWLPRILAKARLLSVEQLPRDYETRFCHPSGVDGQFLAYFGLAREDMMLIAEKNDVEVEAWFRALPHVTPSRIAEWNHIAVNLGRPGFPMAERLPIALATTYKHLNGRSFQTVFEVLEADEGIA